MHLRLIPRRGCHREETASAPAQRTAWFTTDDSIDTITSLAHGNVLISIPISRAGGAARQEHVALDKICLNLQKVKQKISDGLNSWMNRRGLSIFKNSK